MYRVVDTAVDV